ncbi:MAG TPA: CopG family antitoxin [Polyangia bacterium]|jgi:predicted DNA binding CopG/RHH family protein
MSAKKSKLPRFRSDEEERAFWAAHSVEEFSAELKELDVEIRPARTEQIALRLYKEDLEALREVARKKGVGHTTLARSILEQWLARVREKLEAAGHHPRPAT